LRAAQAEAQNEAAAERAAAAAARAEAAETRRIAQRSAFKTAIVAIVACSAIAAVSVAGLAYYLGQRQAKQQAEAAARALALRGKDVLEREGATNALLIAIEGLQKDTIAYVPEMKALAYDALQNLRERLTISAHEDQVGSSEFALRDGTLLSSGADGSLRLWDPASGMLLDERKLPMGGFMRARWSRDSEWVLAGAGHGTGYLVPVRWRTSSAPEFGDPVEFGHDDEKAGPGVFSPDRRLILTGSIGHAPRLWDATTLPLPPRSIWEGKGTGLALGFSADGGRFATGGNDGVVRVYATTDQKLLREQRFGSNVFSLSFHPKNSDLLLATSLGAEPSCGTWLRRAALSHSGDTSAASSSKAPSAPTGTSSQRRQRTTRCGCGRSPSRKPSRPCCAAMPVACSRSASTLRGIGSLAAPVTGPYGSGTSSRPCTRSSRRERRPGLSATRLCPRASKAPSLH
jgi:WD domain, G-beta repeat